jgi:hypothetical protein
MKNGRFLAGLLLVKRFASTPKFLQMNSLEWRTRQDSNLKPSDP